MLQPSGQADDGITTTMTLIAPTSWQTAMFADIESGHHHGERLPDHYCLPIQRNNLVLS